MNSDSIEKFEKKIEESLKSDERTTIRTTAQLGRAFDKCLYKCTDNDPVDLGVVISLCEVANKYPEITHDFFRLLGIISKRKKLPFHIKHVGWEVSIIDKPKT
ncbi:hypothetical protein D4R87_03490 [bacterium]|nr:MAG: hypothetical protein D4R87_03490 [bacterium]